MNEPIWLNESIAEAIHDRQIEQHGGGRGLRDRALLESALARPRNLWSYGSSDWAELAASLAYGVARNHPFVDGNKRTAWVLARLFLRANGNMLRYAEQEAIDTMVSLAAGDLSEPDLAAWFRERLD